MANEELFAQVKRLLEQNGAMGVNQLSKVLDIPLSTMQKYLDKDQNYFKKNSARKWVLPDMAANDDMSVASSNMPSIIDSQLMGMNALIETLMSQFRATVTLIEANKPRSTPVAGTSSNLSPELLKLDIKVKELYVVFKKYVNVCPEEYQDLIKNVDLYRLIIEKGLDYLNEGFNTELTSLFLEKDDTLSDEVLKVLESHQKE